MYSKILKIVFIGNVLLHTPFILSIIYSFNYIDEIYRFRFNLAVVFIGFIYWSFIIPWYRVYSISKIENIKEYNIWKKLSIITLLFWPDKNYFTKFENWNKQKLNHYNKVKINLLKND